MEKKGFKDGYARAIKDVVKMLESLMHEYKLEMHRIERPYWSRLHYHVGRVEVTETLLAKLKNSQSI